MHRVRLCGVLCVVGVVHGTGMQASGLRTVQGVCVLGEGPLHATKQGRKAWQMVPGAALLGPPVTLSLLSFLTT